jgi:hypothetical protein
MVFTSTPEMIPEVLLGSRMSRALLLHFLAHETAACTVIQ